jgi:hypothetical protein
MRFTLLVASAALAVSLTLSACSSGSSQAIPRGSSVAPMRDHAPRLVVIGGKTSCGSAFYECVTLHPGTTTIELCVTTSGNCTSGLYSNWNWASEIFNYPSGKRYRKIKASFSPNPGNPTTNIFKVKKIKNTHGKVKWYENVTLCNVYFSSCDPSAYIGLIGG